MKHYVVKFNDLAFTMDLHFGMQKRQIGLLLNKELKVRWMTLFL